MHAEDILPEYSFIILNGYLRKRHLDILGICLGHLLR